MNASAPLKNKSEWSWLYPISAALVVLVFSLMLPSCGMAPTAVFVQGPGLTGNNPPTLTLIEPVTNITRGQGDPFLIRWTDTDRDDNAQISFALVDITTNGRIPLVDGIDENDTTGPDQVTIGTSLVPVGVYNLVGVIDDGVNAQVETFATTSDAVSQRTTITIVGAGEGGSTVPPIITVTEPAFDQSVSQDDILRILVQPSPNPPDPAIPFDPDSNVTIFFLLDRDQNPNNDDPANPDPSQIILLDTRTGVAPTEFDAITSETLIDLATIPPLEGGEPYFIRATIDDETNPRVHQYAVGTISVVQLAAGTVDLFDIGRGTSGARIYGFTPGASLGSSMKTISDFDADGVEDFVINAQFGNPRNVGLVGEAYLFYGIDGTRLGGEIGANSVGESVSGVIFEAPPMRNNPIQSDGTSCQIEGSGVPGGINDVAFIPDISGDGRPEIFFSLPHVEGAFDGADWDPGDQDIATGDENRTAIEVVIRQREVTVAEAQGAPVVTSSVYAGVTDVTIDKNQPNLSFSSETGLEWGLETKWGLIKFEDVIEQLPDPIFSTGGSFLDIASVQAQLEFRVFQTGGNAEVYEAVTGFTNQTTYSTFSEFGGDPIIDDPDTPGVIDGDYIPQPFGQGDLGNIDAGVPDTVTIDITQVVQKLLNGQLGGVNEELRFILIHDGDEGGDAGVRTSEFAQVADRPKLIVEYDRVNLQGQTGCYPDDLPNNKTDSGDDADEQYYSGGMVVMVDSSNRANFQPNGVRPGTTPERLENTVVTLELAGQRPQTLDADGINPANGDIFSRVDDYNRTGRIAGARFQGGPFDCIDHRQLNQPARSGFFGQNVASIGDLNNDGLNEIIISAPFNEPYVAALETTFGPEGSHLQSTQFTGSIVVIPGANYNAPVWGDQASGEESTNNIPTIDLQRFQPFGACQPAVGRDMFTPPDAFEVFAENASDELGGARSAGDFNQDGLDDILCGAPRNDRSTNLRDTGAAYVLYGRNVLGDFRLSLADDPLQRTPMLRIRGESPGDQIGWRQETGLDVNGDRIDDVFIASPRTDFGGVVRSTCGSDFTNDGIIDGDDYQNADFNSCRSNSYVFTDDSCKAFDYDNDGDVDDDDNIVFECLRDGGDDCCENLVDNGFVGIIFGGVFTDGDRRISQIATNDLPGVIFYGAAAGHRAGVGVSSAGDFNQDGFGDLLITVPGETRLDSANRPRLGVTYLIFGGTQLFNTQWSLDQVGTEDLPGIVFLSPYVKGRPNEAAPEAVAAIGDINRDGFDDIAIGNPKADFIDFSFPQGPNATDAELGRRRNAGDAYVIYGNNFGSNRGGG
ncbi:MAG: integrin alpha [Planctomycetota bacterium]